MTAVRIAVIGAGSAYMPGIVRGLIRRAEDLAGSEIVLHDVDPAHLELMERLSRRMLSVAAEEAGRPPAKRLSVRATLDLEGALTDGDFVLTTFRPGGLEARHLDEAIPLRHGVVGQETAGPGGFLMACRSVPVLLRIVEILRRRAPGAWIANYTNPTSIVTGAVLRFGGWDRIVGLCDQWAGDQRLWASLLGYPPDSFEADWIGLNHATWAQRVRLDGSDASEAIAVAIEGLDPASVADAETARLVEIARLIGCLPNSYARYYYFHGESVAALQSKATTRAQELMARAPAWYADYERAAASPNPDPSTERGGGSHGDFAVDAICALANNESRRLIVNVTNGGAIEGLDAGSVVEVPAIVGADGPRPLSMGPLPRPVRGLTAAIETYEWLAAEAAATGDRRISLQAIASHPFVRGIDVARAILDEGLAAHRTHVPQFFGGVAR